MGSYFVHLCVLKDETFRHPGSTSHPPTLTTLSLAANKHSPPPCDDNYGGQPVLDHRRVLCRFLGENQEICEDLVLGTCSSVFIWNNNYDRLSHNCTPKRIVFLFLARDKVLYSVQKRKKKRLHNYYYYLWVLPIVTQKSWELNSCCVATIFAMNYGNSEIYILFKLNHTQFISFVPL